MNLKIDNSDLQEVFEILCDIPFEKPTLWDLEPPTTRHQAIESLIKQIEIELELKKKRKEVKNDRR